MANERILMNRKFFTAMIMLLSMTSAVCATGPAEIWVSTEGDDRNDASEKSPLRSLAMAVRKARELRRLGDPSINEACRTRQLIWDTRR